MNEYKPLVSIIIPVYNGADYLREAIDSALSQTYEKTEIIVVNDGSDDGGATEKIILSYGGAIRFINKENGGVSSALNAGICAMKGEYFSWLSHDDLYLPTKIEDAVRALRYADDKTMIMCGSGYIDKNSKPVVKKSKDGDLAAGALLPWNTALHRILKGKSLNGCALLIPKSALVLCGMFSEDLPFCQDALMWSRLFLNGYSLYYTGALGAKIRLHSMQLTQRRQDLYKLDCEKMSAELIPAYLDITDKNERFIYEYARDNARHGNRAVVLSVLKAADTDKLSIFERLSLGFWNTWGAVRPFIRKAYYLFKGIRVR